MPIRISRASAAALTAAAFALVAACAPNTPVRQAEPAATLPPESLLANADAALERGDYPAAARAYRDAAERSDDEQVAEQATRAAYDHGQLREAARAAARWLELNPSSEGARRYAGIVALRLHRLDEAEQHFAELLQTAYISPAAGFLALPPVIADEGSPTDVAELFRRLAARHPDVAEAHYAHASAALRADHFANAEQAATLAAGKAPYWRPARMLLARTQIAAGREEAGLELARDLVVDPEADIGLHLEYALMLAATGRDQESRAMLLPYVTGETVVPGALRTLGVLELDAGNLDAAAALFEKLHATGTLAQEALYFLGMIAERRKDVDRALRYYGRVTAGDYAMSAQQRVARMKAEQSGLAAGLAHLDEFARAQPQLAPEVIAARASLLAARGDRKRATQAYDDGIARYPDALELRLSRVFFLESHGRADAAIRELRDLLAERPADAQIQNALGYTLADQNRNLDEARSLITAALAQSPDNAAILDSMGWLLHREGRHAEALEYLQRARKAGSDPEIDLHLGEVQWALGERDAARSTWTAALERWPDDERLQRQLQRKGP
jgi:tetratricopeptide (TPR) repeat protein